jgi:rhodanese-related sulfurtransferase
MKRLRLLLPLLFLAGCSNGGVPRIEMSEFDRLRSAGPVVIVDVRSRLEYEAGHLPGAISVPIDQVEARIDELRNLQGRIVTYCSCAAEETSLAAAATMARLGVKDAKALVGGFPGWVAAGRRVVKGPAPL